MFCNCGIFLDSLSFKNATVFIKSVFYFVISHGRDRVVRENAAHASIQLCGSCVKKYCTAPQMIPDRK